MAVFTDGELEFLLSQRLARLATASKVGQPDVSAVGFAVSGDTIVSRGIDLTKTIRYRHLLENPQATIVIDDLVAAARGQDPRARDPRRRPGSSPDPHPSAGRVELGINTGADKRFAS